MDTLSYKTISANSSTVEKQWVIVDAQSAILGRLASEVAKILRGKTKPSFTPNVDCGDKNYKAAIAARETFIARTPRNAFRCSVV